MTARLGRYDSTTNASEIAAWDTTCGGTKSGFTRHYLNLPGVSFSGSFVQYAFAHDRIPNINIHARDDANNAIQWDAVANGDYDDDLNAATEDFLALTGRNVPAYFVFHHEPENDMDGNDSDDIIGTCGMPDDFIAAATHFRDVLTAAGVTFADGRFGVTLMAPTYDGHHGGHAAWVTDVPCWFYGADGYNHADPTDSFTDIIGPLHAAAVAAGKKSFIQEIGCAKITGSSFKSQFIDDMKATGKTWSELVGIQYSNTNADYDYRVNTGTPSLNSWISMAQDSFYSGSWT
jgi:hypothetical protein